MFNSISSELFLAKALLLIHQVLQSVKHVRIYLSKAIKQNLIQKTKINLFFVHIKTFKHIKTLSDIFSKCFK